jgi:hydrogenase nickel incorporation protein HypA/HybF
MHEISICQSILNTVQAEMGEEDIEHIRQIHLKIGLLSCVEPEVLKHVFSYIKLGTPFEHSELMIELVEVSAQCETCGSTFIVEKYKFVCPQCESPVTNIIEGKELLINKIILEEPSHAEADK